MQSVTVIIPCYNCGKYVSETLESLERQSYSNFSVICINDGSTDNTAEILHSWKKKERLHLKVIDQPNSGVSAARNAGLNAAIGEYILFLDADDLYHPCFIEYMVNAIETQDVDVAYCRLSRNKQQVMAWQETAKIVHKSQYQAMQDLLFRMGDFGFYCYIYRRELLQRIKLVFDMNTKRMEDREFNWKYLCHCQTAVLVDAPLYYYRRTVNSVTQRKRTEWRTDGIDAVKRIEDYMSQMQCPFLPVLQSYLFARVIWACAKNYALSGRKDLLLRLGKEYDVRTCMKRTARDKNKLVAIASLCYLVSPKLYYFVVRLKRR